MVNNKKIYQVFVSSTYTDLETERLKVIRDMLMFDFYPLGMESFPASSEEQLRFCQRMIDRCDYFVLIIGTRYGTEAEDGLSYTELEYDYAKSKNIPIITFISEDPENKPFKFYENEIKRKKLDEFKKRILPNSMVRFWKTADDLSSSVIASLNSEKNIHPRYGLIRSNTNIDIPEILKNIDIINYENKKLRSENQYLEESMKKISYELECLKEKITNEQKILEQLEFDVIISGVYLKFKNSCVFNEKFNYNIILKELFILWGPYLYTNDSIFTAKNYLEKIISNKYLIPSPEISMESFNNIKILLLNFNIINIETRVYGLRPMECIKLSKEGDKLLKQLTVDSII